MKQRKLVEVTEDNLEDLLACDDIFLDFFNVFLSSLAFSIPLRFDRLTGTLVRIKQEEDSKEANKDAFSISSMNQPPQYGANEEQREAILRWVKNERLVFFLQTRLYLEYKLCRYLVRPLRPTMTSANRNGSRSQSQSKANSRLSARLGGVSRTDEVSSADSLAGNKSCESSESYEYQNLYEQLQAGFRYLRPGSRAFSLPVYLTHLRHSIATNSNAFPNPNGNIVVNTFEKEKTQFLGISGEKSSNGSEVKHLTSNCVSSEKRSSTNQKQSSTNRASEESDLLVNKSDLQRRCQNFNLDDTEIEKENDEEDENFEDDEEIAIEEVDDKLACIEFDEVNDQDNLVVVKDLASTNENGANKIAAENINSLQESKEIIFKNREIMKEFTKFLQGTQGETLMNFWIDCEQFRDDMTQFEELETHEIQSKVYLHAFRELLDKYGLKLTNETKTQLINERSDNFSPAIFSKAQYDALKRLRCYWVPRFVIYCQTKAGTYGTYNLESTGLDIVSKEKSDKFKTPGFETLTTIDFLPSLNVARTLSVQPEVSWSDASNPMVPWIKVLESGKRPDERIKSANRNSRLKTAPSAFNFVSEIDHVDFKSENIVSLIMGEDLITLDEVTMCIVKDKDSGGPFQRYLQQMCLSSDSVEQTLTSLAQYLYWQDMLELMEAEQRVGDRLIRLSNAWGIFNKYFTTTSLWAVTRDIVQIEQLRVALEERANERDVNMKCSHVFKGITENILKQLKSQWIDYAVKDSETLESSLDFDFSAEDDCNKQTTGTDHQDQRISRDLTRTNNIAMVNRDKREPRVTLQNRVVVNEESTLAEKQLRLQNAFQIAQDIEQYRKKQSSFLSQARKRKKKKKVRKTVTVEKSNHADTLAAEKQKQEEAKEKKRRAEKASQIKTLSSVKDFLTPDWQSLTRDFVKYCESYEGFNTLLLFRLFLEIQKYNKLVHQSAKVKDVQSQLIYTTYLDAYAPLRVNLPKKYLVKEKLTPERMKATEDYIEKQLRAAVKIFYEGHKWSQDHSKTNRRMSIGGAKLAAEGAHVAEKIIPPMWVRRRVENRLPSKSAALAGIRAIPSEGDRSTFSKMLAKETTSQECRDILNQFHDYLQQYGADQELPYISNSLKFFIEVYKLTQFIHQDQHDDVVLRRKLNGIIDIYVDCHTSDEKIQIETSSEQAAKMLRQCQMFIRGSSNKGQGRGHHLEEVSEFVQTADLIKEQLLQFWSAFWKKRNAAKGQKRSQHKEKSLMDMDLLDEDNKEGAPEEFQILFEMPKQKPVGNQFGSSVSFTLLEGIKWKGFTTDETSSRDNLDIFGGASASQGGRGSAALATQAE